ncbi:MAG: hypothetical protein AB8B58_15655 [Roseobacter sp.]
MQKHNSNAGLYASVGLIGAAVLAVISNINSSELWILGTLWLVLFALTLLAQDSAADADTVTARIQEEDNLGLYTYLTDKIIAFLVKVMAPAAATAQKERLPQKGTVNKIVWYLTPRAVDTPDLIKICASPWSWPVMNAAMKLAVIYPLLLLLVQWAWTGVDTGIGSATILEAEARYWLRYGTIGWVALLLITGIMESASQRQNWENAVGWLFSAGAGAAAVAGAVGYACQHGKGRTGHVALVLTFYLMLITVFAFSSPGLEDDRKSLVFALGMLPLLNAVFDYVSYGATISLITFGKDQKNLWSFAAAVADAALAYVLLVALGSVIVLTIGLINALSAVPFLDITAILDGLRDPATRGDYTWLYLTLFSTLVPTGVHFLVALFSVPTWLPIKYKDRLANWVASADTGSFGTVIGGALTACFGAASSAFIVAVLYYGGGWLIAHFEWVGLTILGHVEAVARLFGAL